MWTLVTGGAKNLGSKICLALAEKGYDIVIHYHSSKLVAETVAEKCRSFGVSAETIQGDFSTRESLKIFIDAYIQSYHKTCGLVNNVGNYIIKSALETTADEWHALFQTNLHASFELTKALAPSLKKCKGNVINMGCVGVDSTKADTYATAYMITKQGMLMLTKSFARELAKSGVRVNMVSPGHLNHSVDLPEDHAEIPVGRPASSVDLTRVVTFLMDEKSSYITGQNIDVAGGLRL
ncbi:MAG: NAD(P)-dependent dehydrogenase (short-subunit alcohol dehydrogenase family) [Chlamydiales bacterium]|jgi:NAD(P)-dependent dehydrogenase (short-subunit alcohol dehydrogenase family)